MTACLVLALLSRKSVRSGRSSCRIPPSSPALTMFTYIFENTWVWFSIASARLFPSLTSLSRFSTSSRIAELSVTPSSNRNALSIGTRASTNVHSPLVKSRISAWLIFLLRPRPKARLVSCTLTGVRFFPCSILIASRSDSALSCPV